MKSLPLLTPHQVKYFAGLLTRKTASYESEKLVNAVLDAKVTPLPHQIDAALFAFRNPFSKGAILADEVGLGKTIEAGIVISQKWAEGRRNILIVAPANLRQQWAAELLDKFHLQSLVVDSPKLTRAKKDGRKLFTSNEVIIVSYAFAANYTELMSAIPWDLVIFDEAHKLRNVYRSESVTANILRETFINTPKLLLTATPLQNSLLELYGLVSFIDSSYFGQLDAYKDEYTNLPAGKKGEKALIELRQRLRPVMNRTLRRHVQEYIKYTKRRAFTQSFNPTEEENKLYGLVTEYLAREELYAFSSSQRALTTLLLLKLLGSSSFAISQTLDSIARRVEAEAASGIRRSSSGKKIFDKDLLKTVGEEADNDSIADEDETQLSELEITGMKREAQELRAMAKLAKDIQHDSKADALLMALKQGFNELPKYQAQRKAIIFTESTRTQSFLVDLLEKNGYAGKVVSFNGSGGNETSNLIYQAWLTKNNGTDKISGVKTADRRLALTEYFRDDAEIMVATEAAGEGINLQFCSMVINYDLPWNPQRVEQRIGRCHRYGQKSDVLVFNFINSANRAEQRILQLLTDKFRLFDDVFGASDEILGAIESGFDFERQIANIILSGVRMPEQIDAEFDQIQEQYSDKIEKRKKSSRQQLIDNFDEEVQEKLRVARKNHEYYMARHNEWLWEVSKTVLRNYATFDANSFILHTPVSTVQNGTYSYSEEVPAQYLYRANHPLAKYVLDVAKHLPTLDGTLFFDYTHSGKNISVLKSHIGQQGTLQLIQYNRKSDVQQEEYYVVLAKTAIGESIEPDIAKRMFDLPATYIDSEAAPSDFIDDQKRAIQKIEQDALQRDSHIINEEFVRIAARADDLRRSVRIKLKKREVEIRLLKKDFQMETDMSKRLDIQRRQILLSRKQDEEEADYRAKSRAIDDEMLQLNDQVRASIESSAETTVLFTCDWKLL